MSGHSKWSTIKHKKGAADAKRGKLFSKLIREITVAARTGGGDIDANIRLRAAVLKAKSANMPKDTIDRAIKKGSGNADGIEYIELLYEGYGAGGAALLVETLTDNKNRTAADIRSIFSKSGGNLGESGCVSYLFKRKGIIIFDSGKYDEEKIFAAALEAGASDVTVDDGSIEVLTEAEEFSQVLETLQNSGFTAELSEVKMLADATITLDNDKTNKVLKLIDKLEDNDDVQMVSSNIDIADDFQLDD